MTKEQAKHIADIIFDVFLMLPPVIFVAFMTAKSLNAGFIASGICVAPYFLGRIHAFREVSELQQKAIETLKLYDRKDRI